MGYAEVFRDEQLRLAELARYRIVMEHKEDAFCDLARLANFISKTPIGGVSLVDHDHVWLKGRVGVDLACLAREGAFCSYAVESNEDMFVVPDTLNDERFRLNPLVASAPFIRFYAAANLIGHRGYRLGTLWVMDTKPRQLAPEECDAMLSLAAQVVRLLELRYQNSVTHLANRGAFVSNLQCAINQRQGGSQVCRIADCRRKTKTIPCISAVRDDHCVVGYIQLRNMHLINGAYGQAAGEHVMTQLAAKLRDWAGETNMLGHVDGDNFAFALFQEIDSPETGERLEQLQRLLGTPIMLDSAIIHLAVSIGISSFPESGVNAASLLDQAVADAALQRSGYRAGSNSIVDQATKMLVEMVDLQHTLSADIREHRVLPNYQPEIDVLTGRIVGFEALARLRHAQAGLVEPRKFIHMAEQSGLVRQLDLRVFAAVCSDMSQWRSAGLEVVPVSLNMSAATLAHPELVAELRKAIEEHGIEPALIGIEVNESVVLDQAGPASKSLAAIRAMGIKVVIDDFGSKLTSLSVLRSIKFDRLKADRRFVHRASSNLYVGGILRLIKGISESFAVELVCKGIEEEDDLVWVTDLGCRRAQGWYFGKSLAPELIPEMRRRLDEFHAGRNYGRDSLPMLAACLQSVA